MNKINEIAVRKCPFCGSGDFDVLISGMVVCTNGTCHASGPVADTMLNAVEKWNTRPWDKHLEHMVESHMDVIDKQVARIKELEAEVAKLHRYLDLMEVSEYYDDFECVHEWEALEPIGENNLMCELCGALGKSKPSTQANASECEHMWRQSPYDAGLTFCCLCGIEYDAQESY